MEPFAYLYIIPETSALQTHSMAQQSLRRSINKGGKGRGVIVTATRASEHHEVEFQASRALIMGPRSIWL